MPKSKTAKVKVKKLPKKINKASLQSKLKKLEKLAKDDPQKKNFLLHFEIAHIKKQLGE